MFFNKIEVFFPIQRSSVIIRACAVPSSCYKGTRVFLAYCFSLLMCHSCFCIFKRLIELLPLYTPSRLKEGESQEHMYMLAESIFTRSSAQWLLLTLIY